MKRRATQLRPDGPAPRPRQGARAPTPARGVRRPLSREELRALLSLALLGLALASAAALLMGLRFSPEELEAGAPLVALGLEPRACPGCPLCGLSRGFALVSRGRPLEALALNPLVALAFPLACAALAGAPFALRALARSRRSGTCAS